MKLKIGLEYSDKSSFFELKLFSKASTKFVVDLRTCSRYPKDALNLRLYGIKKKQDTRIHIHDKICKNVLRGENGPHLLTIFLFTADVNIRYESHDVGVFF